MCVRDRERERAHNPNLNVFRLNQSQDIFDIVDFDANCSPRRYRCLQSGNTNRMDVEENFITQLVLVWLSFSHQREIFLLAKIYVFVYIIFITSNSFW